MGSAEGLHKLHSSLCNLRVLCVSVVDEFRAKTHHRDTENTEFAQRISGYGLFVKAVRKRKNGAPGAIPTRDLPLRRRALYAAELREHK